MPSKAPTHSARRVSTCRVIQGPKGCASASVSIKAATGKPASSVGDTSRLIESGLISEAKIAKNGRSNSSDNAVKNTISRIRTIAVVVLLSSTGTIRAVELLRSKPSILVCISASHASAALWAFAPLCTTSCWALKRQTFQALSNATWVLRRERCHMAPSNSRISTQLTTIATIKSTSMERMRSST